MTVLPVEDIVLLLPLPIPEAARDKGWSDTDSIMNIREKKTNKPTNCW